MYSTQPVKKGRRRGSRTSTCVQGHSLHQGRMTNVSIHTSRHTLPCISYISARVYTMFTLKSLCSILQYKTEVEREGDGAFPHLCLPPYFGFPFSFLLRLFSASSFIHSSFLFFVSRALPFLMCLFSLFRLGGGLRPLWRRQEREDNVRSSQ